MDEGNGVISWKWNEITTWKPASARPLSSVLPPSPCSVLHPELSVALLFAGRCLRGASGDTVQLPVTCWLDSCDSRGPRTFSHCQPDQWWRLSECSHSAQVHLPEQTPQMFPSLQPVSWFSVVWCSTAAIMYVVHMEPYTPVSPQWVIVGSPMLSSKMQ